MLQAGVRLGDRYRLEDRLGAGGMGEVWRAVDEVLRRPVAVKAMLPSVAAEPEFARRFLAEATAMARVNHPAVASIHDYGRSGDVTYLVMELIEGESLAQVLRRAGRLGPAETMWLVAQAADGLQAVHGQGIVHRDIKPANLMVRPDGSVLITDFGISRADDASPLTASGAVLGTPTYLSPEQVLGQPATPRSDVYSLGLTAYECLAGHRPFAGDNPYAVALQRLQDAPRTIGVALPPAVLTVVERALATDPAGRWPSAAALAEAARAAAASGAPANPAAASGAPANLAAASGAPAPAAPRPAPAAARPTPAPAAPARPAPPPAPQPARPRSRKPGVLAALAALLLIGGGFAVWTAVRDDDAEAAAPPANAASQTPRTGTLAGFTACDDALCPTEPLCWGGMASTNGRAAPPERLTCEETHAWETFAAVPVAAGEATEVRPETLIDRPDVAAACAPDVMAARSHDPGTTGSWVRDAWPIQTRDGDWLIHCMARPELESADEPAFRTG